SRTRSRLIAASPAPFSSSWTLINRIAVASLLNVKTIKPQLSRYRAGCWSGNDWVKACLTVSRLQLHLKSTGEGMNDGESRLLVTILQEIRDNQKMQLDRQVDALALQREQFAIVQRQAERYEHIQDRAEHIQARSAQIMAVARKTMFVALPILTIMIAYVSWLIFGWLIR